MVNRIKKLLASPVFPNNEGKTFAASVLNLLLWACIGFLVFDTVNVLFFDLHPISILINFVLIPVGIAMLIALHRGYVRTSGILTISIFWLAVTTISLVFTGLTTFIILAYFAVVLLSGVIISRRAIGVLATLSTLAIGVIFALEQAGWITAADFFGAMTNVISSVMMIAVVAVVLSFTLKKLEMAMLGMRQNQQDLEKARATLADRIADSTKDLNLASEASRELAQIRDLESLLNQTVELTKSNFDLYYSQLYLLDEAAQKLVLRAGTGTVGRRLINNEHYLLVNMLSINGKAVLEKRTIVVADTKDDPAFRPNPLLPDMRSEISIPLMAGERVLGVLNMQDSQPNAFSPDNITAFEFLAGQVSIAIVNALLIEEQQATAMSLQDALSETELQAKRVAILNDIGMAFNAARDVDELFFIVSRQILKLIHGDRATVAMVNPDGETFQVLALEGENDIVPVGTNLPLSGTAVGRAIRENRILRLPADIPFNDYADSKQLAAIGMQSFIAVPLIIDNEVVGTLNVASKESIPFNNTEVAVVRQVAAQLASSIQSHRLHERINRLAAIVENHPDLIGIGTMEGRAIYMNPSGLKLLGLPADVDVTNMNVTDFTAPEDAHFLMEVSLPTALEFGVSVGETVVHSADGRIIPVEQTISINYDEDRNPSSFSLTVRDISERKQSEEAQQKLTSQLEERLLQFNALQRIMTREGWSAFLTASNRLVHGYTFDNERIRLLSKRDLQKPEVPGLLSQEGGGSSESSEDRAGIPITVRGEIIGVLGVRNPSGEPLTITQQNLLNTLSLQLADALERARLFEEMESARAQTEALYSGSEQVIQANTLSEILQAIVDNTSLKHLDRANLIFFDMAWEDTMPDFMTVVSIWRKRVGKVISPDGMRLRLQDVPVLTELERHKPFISNDIQQDSRFDEAAQAFFVDGQNARSLLVFPIVSNFRWIGLLVAQSDTVQNFNEDEIRQINGLVSQAATVAQTQRLFTETQMRARREQALREITARVFAAPDAETILRTAAQEIHQVIGLETAVYLQDVDKKQGVGTNGNGNGNGSRTGKTGALN